MESEYTLSQSMRDLISLCEILKEIIELVFNKPTSKLKCSSNSKSFNDIISDESESPIPKS